MNDRERHLSASQRMQSGVATEESTTGPEASKHLRVGINVALCDHAALVGLLIAKGVLTEDEYTKAIADEMEREVKRMEERLSRMYGVRITLGEAGFGRME